MSLADGRPNSGSEKATQRIIANQSSGLRAAFSCLLGANAGLEKRHCPVCYSLSFTCGFAFSILKIGR